MSSFRVVKLVDPIQLNLAGGLNFQGDYDNTTAYVVGDVVTYNGSSYAATQGTTGNLPTDVSNWQLLAEKGDPLTVNAGTNIDIDVISPTEITVNTVEDDDATLAANSATVIPSQKAVKAYADTKVAGNAAIVGATKTKITYDAKGLVTAGADATTADIADSTDKRYVTDANLTVIGNTSGTNTGDNATNTQYSGLDAAKVNKAGDTMAGNLNMGTNKLIGGTGITDILKLQGTTGNGTAGSAAIQLLTGDNGATTALTVLNNGNVGIGTTTPQARLDVLGGVASGLNDALWLSGGAAEYNSGPRMVFHQQFGVNNSYPNWRLGEIGSIYTTTGATYAGALVFNINKGATVTDIVEGMRLTYNSRLGINETAPGAQLQVTSGAATTVGQIIKGAASQTADLLQLQNSSGTVLSKFTSAGNLLLPGGSSGTPSLSFTSDPSSGFYSIATNYFGVSAGGSLVATYQNNSGRKGTLLYGNTYSGTVANAVLTLSTDSSILATHSIDQTNKKYLIQPYESGVNYNVDTILNSLGGNVGIGTTTPDSIFTLDAPTNLIANDYGTFTIRNNSDTNKHLSMGIDTSIGTWGSAYIKAVRTTSAVMPLLLQPSGGVVGITTGTDTIGARFQVNTGAAATIGQIIKGASAQTADLLQLQDSSANKLMVVSSGGNVGIGTTAPSEKLDVSGTVKATGYKSSDGSAGVSGSFTTTDGKTITIKDGLVVSIV